jgi:hypothetical protein
VLTAWLNGSSFSFHVAGIGESVAEIGEQLAWLGAALRSSPYSSGVAYCTPHISNIRVCDNAVEDPISLLESKVACQISFTMRKEDRSSTTSNGQCWHNLFDKPVVVQGFPIPRRSEPDTGLEIPLNIMAGLARARHVNVFDGVLLIKGFSTMLVPTKKSEKLLIWHLLYTESGSRISYLDKSVPHVKGVSMNDVENSRHILGWCSDAKYYAGKLFTSLSLSLLAGFL